MNEYPRYFYKCNSCDSEDRGSPLLDFEIVDCPACGSRNLTKWLAQPNLSRDWSYCQAFGHDWAPVRNVPDRENCLRCGEERDFSKKRL